MDLGSQQAILESRAGRPVYFGPLILALCALSALVAWIILQLVFDDRSQLDVLVPLLALTGLANLTLAAVWTWGARRSRLVITNDRLTVSPTLGKSQSVRLSRLASVDLRRVANGQARILNLTDADGASAQVGLGGAWEREADILRLIGDAARRTDAKVEPEAKRALADRHEGS